VKQLPLPKGEDVIIEISDARWSLLKMSPDYTVEFVWIMSKYNACKREDLDDLIRAPSMKPLISKYAPKVIELMGAFGSDTRVPAE